MKTMITGFLSPWIIYAGITLLHFALPGRWTGGYVRRRETGEVLRYRLNGIAVLSLSVLLWLGLGLLNRVPPDFLYRVRWTGLAGALTLGFLYSLIMVLPCPSGGKPFPAELWFGRLENPQYRNGRIDAKMWLYLIGAVMLQLNVCSFAAYHRQTFADPNPGVRLCAILLSWFVWDYLCFEKVHLYTYDFIAERVGFKLGFGCLAFYPYFYAVSLWATANLPNPRRPLWFSVCAALVFFAGWIISRGANLQKYRFKTAPDKPFLGIRPVSLSDGKHSLLANGFWGASRHINYLGEILMGCGIALSTGYPGVWQVWLYPLYYALLLGTRQIDDDHICRAKYGKLWDDYTRKVKYRIIPFIY